jgi:hypothetical protein
MKIIKNIVSVLPSDKKRVYHTIEGSHDGFYFFAKTDNSHNFGFKSYGIKNGSVYKLDVWEGGHPVGRNSIKGKSVHVSEDYVAGYYNKWQNRPTKAKHKKIVEEIIKYLDSIQNKK